MSRGQNRFDRFLACAVVTLTIVGWASGAASAEREAGLSQWAIVGDGAPESSKLVDLLTAELSKDAGLRLVEREDIQRVLDEQQLSLSGLVARAQDAKLGQLLPADAFLVIEQRSATSHLRLIESRSGILLWDYLGSDAANSVGRLGEELLKNAKKLATPIDERKYVALMGFVAEESDELLRAWTYALPALLERDLRMQPGCCVLERRQLHRLTDERDLTKIELQLRGASILVEGSLRRGNPANPVEMTLKLMRPDGRSLGVISVESVSSELSQATRDAATVILRALDGSKHEAIEIEASRFAERADWLISNGLLTAAKSNAYAAAAIEPTRRNLSRVFWIHDRRCEALLRPLRRQDFTTESTRDQSFETIATALREARIAHEYDAKQLQLAIDEGGALRHQAYREPSRDDPSSISYKEIFDPFIPVAPTTEPASVASERESLRKTMLAKYDLVAAAARDRLDTDSPYRREYVWLLTQRLSLAAYFESSSERYAQYVLSTSAEIDRARAALENEPHKDDWRPAQVEALRQATSFGMLLSLNPPTFDSAYRDWCRRSRDWSPDVLQPIVASLATHSDPAIRLVACERRAWASGAAAAGIAALDLPPEYFHRTTVYDYLFRNLGTHLGRHNRLASVVEPYLRKLEQSRDRSLLSCGIFAFVGAASDVDRIAWQKRILRAFPEQLVEGPERRYLVSLKFLLLQQLTGDEYNEFSNLGPDLPTTARTVDEPQGTWNHFTYTTLDLNPIGGRGYCFYGCLGVHPRTQTPELLLLWRPDLLQRVALDGELRSLELGRPEAASADCREVVTASATPAGHFWDKRYAAILAAVYPDLPAEIKSANVALRWCRGQLYLGNRGLQMYDPTTRQIQNLTRSLRLDARTPLDATQGYWIRGIHVEPDGDRLFLEIDSHEPIGGIWQYTPADHSLKQVVSGSAKVLHWSEGMLVFEQLKGKVFWHLLDPESHQVTSLTGYTRDRTGEPTIKLGQYFISSYGKLHTNDGKIHRFPISEHGWEVMMPIEDGFVAAEFDDRPVRVWKFQLNKYIESNEKAVGRRPAAGE